MDMHLTVGAALPEGVTPLRVAEPAADGGAEHPPPPFALFVGSLPDHTAAVEELVARGSVVLFAGDLRAAHAWLENVLPDRDTPAQMPRLTHGAFEIDLVQRRVRWRNANLPVTDYEFRVLASLAEAPGRIRSFQELMREVWGVSHTTDAAPLRSLVKRLRKKLTLAGAGLTIEAVRGIGYRLELIGPELPQ